MRTTDTMTISLPPAMARQMEIVRKKENRTRSELLREAWRHYFESRYAVYQPTREEAADIRKGRTAIRRGQTVSLRELHDELDAARQQTRRKTAGKTPR